MYVGFSWSLDETVVPIAFPAVRGEICVEEIERGNLNCHLFDPCPAAHNCSCEWWQDGQRYCFEENNFKNWDKKFRGYAQQQNLVAIATWLSLNETYLIASNLNTSRVDDDWIKSWACEGSGIHEVTMSVVTEKDTWNRGWDGFVLELHEKSEAEELDAYTLITSSSPTTGSKTTIEQFLCPEKTYALSVTAPEYPKDDLQAVHVTISDINMEFVVRGEGIFQRCEFYGEAGTNIFCQSNPTVGPTASPTVVPFTTYTRDPLNKFDPGIWNRECEACSYLSTGGLRVTGIDFQRSKASALVRKLEVNVNFQLGDNPVVVLTTQEDYDWEALWTDEVGSIKFGFVDKWKFLKGQSEMIYCSCPLSSETNVELIFEVTSNGISFTDNVCASLDADDDAASMACSSKGLLISDDIGETSVYTMLGSFGIFMPVSSMLPYAMLCVFFFQSLRTY